MSRLKIDTVLLSRLLTNSVTLPLSQTQLTLTNCASKRHVTENYYFYLIRKKQNKNRLLSNL